MVDKKLVVVILIGAILIPFAVYAAGEVPEGVIPILEERYQGGTRITDMINSADPSAVSGILTSESDTIMKLVTFPYTIPGTEITVTKYKCDFKAEYCNFWITAYRGGEEVQTNSPVGISPPPYIVIVSESYNPNTNVLTVTLREDPQAATAQALQQYVNTRPLGNGTSRG
jgi:hypothetical protein